MLGQTNYKEGAIVGLVIIVLGAIALFIIGVSNA